MDLKIDCGWVDAHPGAATGWLRVDRGLFVPHCILIADDEAPISHLLSRKLEQEGFDVMVAQDGEEAWELAQERTPDLVITDLQMPFMSGLDLAHALRGHEPTSRIPLIMLTARGYVLEPEVLQAARITELHAKPFGLRRIVERVKALLAGTPSIAATPPDIAEAA